MTTNVAEAIRALKMIIEADDVFAEDDPDDVMRPLVDSDVIEPRGLIEYAIEQLEGLLDDEPESCPMCAGTIRPPRHEAHCLGLLDGDEHPDYPCPKDPDGLHFTGCGCDFY